MAIKYTREVLAEAAANSTSIAGVQRYLGLRLSGGGHAHISRRLKHFGIDTSHFTGQAHSRGKAGRRKGPEERLVMMPYGSKRTPGQRLLTALVSRGRIEQCESCGIGPVWRNAKITLQVDHINGDFLDNREENLRVLCPNCHSQTPTFSNRRRLAAPGVDSALQ